MKTYFVYIIECSNGSFYTGYTTDPKRRYEEHVAGSAKCKYTRSFAPKRLAACWEIGDNLSLALKIEKSIKKMTKSQKQLLIDSPNTIHTLYK